jgi:hypothetical protein
MTDPGTRCDPGETCRYDPGCLRYAHCMKYWPPERSAKPVLVEVVSENDMTYERAWYCAPPAWGAQFITTDEDWDDGPPVRRNIYHWKPPLVVKYRVVPSLKGRVL